MARNFQKWMIALWLGSLVVSTTGVSIHRVFCACKNKASLSLFFEKGAACHAGGKASNCCSNEKGRSAEGDRCPKKHDGKAGCSDRSFKLAKLEAKFLETEKTAQLIDFQAVAIEVCSWAPQAERAVFLSEKSAAPSKRRPPPKRAGRELGQFLCVFRC